MTEKTFDETVKQGIVLLVRALDMSQVRRKLEEAKPNEAGAAKAGAA